MISPTELRAAAEAIRRGELVVFPTETVYGLGANALDPEAVARIFEVKGRPQTSPLIVHVASIEQARGLVADWPPEAQKLAERFWPGPLTLVLRKQDRVPDMVTAGLDSVGIRMPAHDVALALIAEAGVPLAAPSANRFTELSPTRAEHVRNSLGGRVAMILDDGPTQVGIESAVLWLREGRAELLRPGAIARAEMESVVGPIHLYAADPAGAHRSPGQHARHYQPRTPLLLVDSARDLPGIGRGAYLCHMDPGVRAEQVELLVRVPDDPASYAARLYHTLHELDQRHLDWIAVEMPPPGEDWDGVRDRLERARSR